MMRMKGMALVIVCLLAALWAIPAVAQEQTGSIEGTVKDSSGAVLPGVTVEVRSSTGTVVTMVTDALGVYRFPALPPGSYTVTANLQGFAPQKLAATLALGQLLKVDVALSIATVAETVQVTGEAPLIDVKQNATFTTVSSETIARIPKGRDFTGVIAAAAGANAEDRAGGISIAGASGSENRFIVDGVDTTNLRTGASGKTVVTDFIAEVQVKTSGYNAEYPGATGGVVNAITKSGTNQFRGSGGFYYTNNDKLKGDVRPALRLDPTDSKKVQYTHTAPTVSPNWQPVLEMGGPVFKDRLWFYAGYAPERTYDERTLTFKTGGATRTFRQNQPTDRLYGSISSQVTNNLRAKFSFAPTWGRSRGSIPGGIQPYEVATSPDGPWTTYDNRTTANPNTDYASSGSNDWNNSYSGLVDWVVMPNWFVNVSGGYFMTNTETLGNGTAIVHSMDGDISTFAGDPGLTSDLNQINGYVDGKSSSKTVRDKYTRLYLNLASTWYRNAGGQHAIKAGMRFERFGNDRYAGRIEPVITFYWDQDYVSSTGVHTRGKYGYYDVSKGVVGTGNIHSNNWGFFVQDSWSPTSRLTVNAGVRTESEFIPFYTSGDAGGIKFPFSDKIAPRVGFAYDLRGDNKWKLYGSFGRFFDIMKLEMPRGSLGGEQWKIYNYPLDTINWKSINCEEADSSCPGKLLEVNTLRFGSNEANNPETMGITKKYFGVVRNMIQDDIKPMNTQEVTFGIDHELNKVTSFGVRYVHNNVGRAIEDFGWNEDGTEYYIIGNPGYGNTGELRFLWNDPSSPCTATKNCLYDTNAAGGFHPQVKPVRKYDAVEFRLTKRMSDRWFAEFAYTWSRLFGNYPGLASSDEAGSGTARQSPNVNRLYDGPWMMYNTQGQPVEGQLNNDRPHYFKVQGGYDLPWGTTVSAYWYARSGALFSKYITYQDYSWVFYAGRGNLGRSPLEQRVDLALSHDFKIGQRARFNLNLNIANVFDTRTAISIYALQYRDSFGLDPIESFFKGFDPTAVATALGPKAMRPDPRFGLDNIWLGRRDIRLGAKFTF